MPDPSCFVVKKGTKIRWYLPISSNPFRTGRNWQIPIEFCAIFLPLKLPLVLALEDQTERRAALFITVAADTAVMGQHDLSGEAEADAGSFLFCGEKGHENPLLHIFIDPGAIVIYFDDDTAAAVKIALQIDAGLLLPPDHL